MIIKAANSPRPGNWILERSLDGVEFMPWQYYAISDTECLTRYNITPRLGPPKRDDEVICTSHYSRLVPLEHGEVIHKNIILLFCCVQWHQGSISCDGANCSLIEESIYNISASTKHTNMASVYFTLPPPPSNSFIKSPLLRCSCIDPRKGLNLLFEIGEKTCIGVQGIVALILHLYEL